MEVKEISQRIVQNIKKVIVGKDQTIEYLLVSLFSKGHILIDDYPGLAKTTIAKGLAKSIGGVFKRIQGAPDLLPSDITGVFIFNQKSQAFEYKKGPIISNVVLMDEINRSTPRTQSALLEAMAETQITVDGKTFKLPNPFLVIATQNPVEFEGTFPLPEAQRDRFFISINIGYPSLVEEVNILERKEQNVDIDVFQTVIGEGELDAIYKSIEQVLIDRSLKEYIVNIVNKTRDNYKIVLGASPRGSIALYYGSRVLAAIRGRKFVIPDDIKELTIPILRHRIILSSESRLKGLSPESIIQDIVNSVEVPIK